MNRMKATDRLRALRGSVQRRRRRWGLTQRVSVLEDRMTPTAYTVTSNDDINRGNPGPGPAPYRWVINQIDQNGGPSNTITLIPSNELTITPGAGGFGPLPDITEPVDIKGQTQPASPVSRWS